MIGRHLTIALLIQLATAFSEMTVPVLDQQPRWVSSPTVNSSWPMLKMIKA